MTTFDIATPTTTDPPSRRSAAVAALGPNWFTVVMGTGIVANAVVALPGLGAGRLAFARPVWLLAASILVILVAATAEQWRMHPSVARGHLDDVAMAPAYGAVAMAVLTVGAGTLSLGAPLLGGPLAGAVAWTCWVAGTALGLAAALVVPYVMVTRQRLVAEDALGTWLMPVVPPMVSAATGAALVDRLASPTARWTMLAACGAMVGLALAASLLVLTVIWQRLLFHGPGPAATVPALAIVLGPLGQSVTAVNQLGLRAQLLVPAALGEVISGVAVLYGVAVLGFALLWLSLVALLTARALRHGLRFGMSWWAYTFPIGTLVTGASALSLHLELPVVRGLAYALFVLLVTASATALIGTTRGVLRGDLLVNGGLARRRRRVGAPQPR